MLPFRMFRVSGESMLPTYRPGKLLLGRCWFVRPKTGDIIVVKANSRLLVKRFALIINNQIEVIGDNTAASLVSRSFGPLPKGAIKAKIIMPRPVRPRA